MKQVLFLFLLFTHINAEGATYYVSVGGNNANDGSLASPWRTLVHAVRATHPGDTVLVREGTYTDHEVWIRGKFGWGGSPGRMKTLAAYPGEKPVIRSRNGLQIYASWVRIQGFRFYDAGITSNLGDGNIVENIEILDNHFIGNFQYGAIELIGSNLLIAHNTIEISEQNSEMDHGIYLHAGKNNVVRGNRISNPQGFGIHVYDERKRNYTARQLKEGFQNIVIEDNFVSGSKGASGIVVAAADGIPIRNLQIRNNVFTSNNLSGIEIRTGNGIQIFNNTIVNNGRQGIHIGTGSQVANVTITNNIIVNPPNEVCRAHCFWYGRYHIQSGRRVAGLFVADNLYWPTDVRFSRVADRRPIVAEPAFVNAAGMDFRLKQGGQTSRIIRDLGLTQMGSAPHVARNRD